MHDSTPRSPKHLKRRSCVLLSAALCLVVATLTQPPASWSSTARGCAGSQHANPAAHVVNNGSMMVFNTSQQQEQEQQEQQQQQQEQQDLYHSWRQCLVQRAQPPAFPTNFWFVKTYKTGGTTLAGVFMAIAAHYGVHPLRVHAVNKNNTLHNFNATLHEAYTVLGTRTTLGMCGHLPYDDAKAGLIHTTRGPLMRFTAVRHPLDRFHSHWFHSRCFLASTGLGMTRERGRACDRDQRVLASALASDTLEARWQYARGSPRNAQFHYIRGNATTVVAAAARYDFIFVTERMNEGLVVFMLKHGLSFEDTAYLPSKNRTGKYRTAAQMPAELNEFVLHRDGLDMQLWQLANRRLDQERAWLEQQCGASAVQRVLDAFEQLLALVKHECVNNKAWSERHGLPGLQSYLGDAGVGYRCVQHVARQFALRSTLPAWQHGIGAVAAVQAAAT